ncbi:tektin-B1-like [Scomber scombrus]|uniref:tektin-B1-like n=1 Tax=Scomber scombrus TaxID=13677 RepID=UPI002DDB6944|nr:tektin-B1-like [Scomber scombrus]
MQSTDKSLVARRPQLQVLKFNEQFACTLSHDVSRIPSATRSTMRHLTYRHEEVSQWQAQISEIIGQVDREIIALEQVKSTTESFLEEKLLYGQHMSECVEVKNSLNTGVLEQDPVLIELRKEVQLTNEITEVLQKQICFLVGKLSSLKEIHTQLLVDYQDKSEANKLTTKCIIHDVSCSTFHLPADQYKPYHTGYDKWQTNCKDLKLTADSLVKDSSTFRGNLSFTLANLKNAHECQRHNTDGAMQKKIYEMRKVQEGLRWQRQQIIDEIQDLTKVTQRVAGQVRNCDSQLHNTTYCLDILSQRPRYELCLDMPHFSFTLAKSDLTNMASGLFPKLQRCQHDMEPIIRRLSIVEDRMATNDEALRVEQKCRTMHHSFLPLRYTTVVIPSKPRLCWGLRSSSPYSFFQ